MAPHRRPFALALLAGAVALVVTALAAYLWGGEHGGLVLLGRLRDHVVAIGWLTLVALIAAIVLGTGRGCASPSACRWPSSAFRS